MSKEIPGSCRYPDAETSFYIKNIAFIKETDGYWIEVVKVGLY